ncbi:S-adenosylmethionine decarboxylase proenzyme [Wickerhamomyces ciferrii]|uniref:S-adenosylmethionine decarboxylase proenzyme n=1 Tax=Wickerhamomyces ciferrii (strain ATCC 14091 / BCRC 22168 / CBS 111 / JCM 3599 / NBRC 0793 / NRRL Y-1031 F-60-10) TaxID=1206466 RepID=K0KT20_WICCF|nr:S-adenosylmethionine decarboxylase proenzyme [Wickerhamomyces ciferrii]CCH46281.1 S-adenosylmethionine decarboxylase proenzyme [Wickerhamomyces ciferrii]
MTPVSYQAGDNAFVDHELSVNLDSTEAFEGPEKLLEIWFYPSEKDIPNDQSLRNIDYDSWSKILDLVNCKVLSIKSSSKVDAFLLSESSLFVYNHKLILKTCGTTTTLHCLSSLFQLIQNKLGWNFLNENQKFEPSKVFYSRRSFMFPNKQKSIHKNWTDEVDYLNQFFENGSHYLIGRIDNNHWHLYTTSPTSEKETIHHDEDVDETFEILMTELSPDRALQFHTSRKPGFEIDEEHDLGHFLGHSTSNNTGLNNVYGEVGEHDAFAFTPCGYSSNTILNDDSYYTLHVTPERDWSYASFETNVNPLKYGITNVEVLQRVLNVFKPHKFQFTLFSSGTGEDFEALRKLESLKGYKKVDKILYDLDNYYLLYVSYQIDEAHLINSLSINGGN